jgi:gliding motility-associated-like protein
MKKAVFLILSCCFFPVLAAGYHIIGGEIYYKTLGRNGDNTRYRYLITLKLYRDADFTCGDRQGCIDRFENPVTANVYTASGGKVLSTYLYIDHTLPLIDTLKNPCLAPQAQHLEVAFYNASIELPPIPGGYYISSQRCCRGEKLSNIYDSEHEGSTYYTTIPGTESRPNNNSAYFNKDTAIVICNSVPFRLNYAAYDEDGDSLVYHLCNALTDGSGRANENNSATPPPYNTTVRYIPPYNGSNPMAGNPGLSISASGIITCTPTAAGKYVITVCVDEYDPVSKTFLGTHSKDILLTVFNCQTNITAIFPPVLNNCTQDPSLQIPVSNSSMAGFTSTYYWTFGDGTDTLTKDKTLFYHQYPDTGVYHVKMVVNPGLSCSDSATGIVRNYPGLKAGFTISGLCKGDPIQFTDTSSYLYGHITSHVWSFDLADSLITAGTQKTLEHVFTKGDVYTISMKLLTDKQCEKTIVENVRIYEVNPFAGHDTILARGQQLVMQGSGGEFYSWTPSTGLSNPMIANPVLNYNQDISYTLRVSNQQGCFGYATVNVKYYTGPELYIPNAFTPNGDGLNDRFRFIPVGITQYKYFRIYNRWGVEVYSSTDFRTGWDGIYKGRPAPVDTYIWILKGTDFNGKDITKQGTVTLIR